MLLTALRLGFLLATFVASLHVAAAPRVWTLTDVRFSDGAVATGYVIYDDGTGLEGWNLRLSAGTVTPHTHVAGNAFAASGLLDGFFQLYFYSSDPDPRGLWRRMRFAPLAPLDGSSATVSIDVSRARSYEYYEDSDSFLHDARQIIAGTLVLTTQLPPLTIVQVDEFYHSALRRYFITASTAEKADLDTGVHPGWERTEEWFKAYASGSSASGSINPVCRYYGSPLRGLDSHFYSARIGECLRVFWTHQSGVAHGKRKRVPNRPTRHDDGYMSRSGRFLCTGCGISGRIPITAIRRARRSRRRCSLPAMSRKATVRTPWQCARCISRAAQRKGRNGGAVRG